MLECLRAGAERIGNSEATAGPLIAEPIKSINEDNEGTKTG